MSQLHRVFASALLVVMCSLGCANHANAQANACVSLLVGAGYAAEMRIVAGSFSTDWSSSFAIGQTKCQSLNGVGNGIPFSVEVHAILGKTKTCAPSNIARVTSSTSNVVFQAWGTTLDIKCQEPTVSANAEAEAASMSVNAQGKQAAATASSDAAKESADKK